MKKYLKPVTITLDELALLCLSVDYKISGDCKDAVEDLSVELQKKFKFDTHKYRHQINKHLSGAVYQTKASK